MGLPIARFADDREDRQLVVLLALAEEWEFLLEDVLGFERFMGQQNNRESGVCSWPA